MNKKNSVKLFSSLAVFLTAAAIVVSVTVAPFVLPTDDPTDETGIVTSVISDKEDKEHRPQCDDDPVFGHIEDY